MRVAVVGAGVVGLSLAWTLQRRGAQVTLFDRSEAGSGVSSSAAGMIAPAFEATLSRASHSRLYDLGAESALAWPKFASDLAEGANLDFGYAPGPTLVCEASDVTGGSIRRVVETLKSHNIDFELVEESAARSIEPALGDRMQGPVLVLPSDHRVDPKKVCAALTVVSERCGVELVFNREVAGLDLRGGRYRIGSLGPFEAVVLCVGGSQNPIALAIEGVAHEVSLPEIVPVRGQAFAVAADPDLPRHVIRFGSRYIVPHNDRVIIGATVEWGQDDDTPNAETELQLRQAAEDVVPALTGRQPIDRWAGIRPGTEDHAPFLGRLNAPNLYIAAGHYRNGILLAPRTADAMANMILDRNSDPLIECFAPDRVVKRSATVGD